MWDYLKNPDTWMSMIAIVLSIIALFQTSRQVKLSNKQQLFDRRLSRYLEFRMIHSLYTQNKLFLKDDNTFYHTNDLIFSWLTNCSDLEEMFPAMSTPLQHDKQKILLTKHEQLKNAAIEISLIFNGEIASISGKFVSVYADLLKAMYQQQVYISNAKEKENHNMPLLLEDYIDGCKKMAERLGIFQLRDQLIELDDVITRKQIIEKMEANIRLTKVKK